MKRPKLEDDYDALDELNYLDKLEKYCTYLENQNKELTLTDVGSNEVKFFCQHKLVLDCKEQCWKCSRQPNSV